MTKGLTPRQHAAMSLIKTIQGMAMMVPADVLAELVHILVRAETTAPVLDPTFYRANMGEIALTKECLQAFVSYRHELDRLKVETLSRGILVSPGEV